MANFSKVSESRLVGLHPDIIRVLRRAIQTYDFMLIEGVRSDEQCYINYGKGRTARQCEAGGCPGSYAQPTLAKVTWLSRALGSNHRKKPDGFGHAVDIAPYPLDWNDAKRFKDMAKAVKEAAVAERVPLEWGGDWKKKDLPHFELRL